MDEENKVKRTTAEELLVEGKVYAWCTCGLTKKSAFCDGSHRGTGLAPKMFTAQNSGLHYLCSCGKSNTAPTCDGSHQ